MKNSRRKWTKIVAIRKEKEFYKATQVNIQVKWNKLKRLYWFNKWKIQVASDYLICEETSIEKKYSLTMKQKEKAIAIWRELIQAKHNRKKTLATFIRESSEAIKSHSYLICVIFHSCETTYCRSTYFVHTFVTLH